jgi:hypothetical protein
MASYGIRGKELNWFKSFLGNRYQRTNFMNAWSEMLANELGVPQGSIISAILFILYINDIAKVLKHTKIKLFADDTLLYITGKDKNDMISKLNEDLDNIYKWLCINRLKLNADKSVFIILNDKKQVPTGNVIIGEYVLQRVSEIRYLGVVIDEKLNFKAHVEYVLNKANKKLNFLFRTRRKLPKSTRKLLYCSLVGSNLDYCSTILISCCDNELKKLQKVQSKGLRFILNCPKDTRRKEMLDELGWMSVNQKIIFNNLTMIFKMKKKLVPDYLCDKLTLSNNVHDYNTRGCGMLRTVKCEKEKTKRSLLTEGIKHFNKLDIDETLNCDLKKFKKIAKKYVLENVRIIK